MINEEIGKLNLDVNISDEIEVLPDLDLKFDNFILDLNYDVKLDSIDNFFVDEFDILRIFTNSQYKSFTDLNKLYNCLNESQKTNLLKKLNDIKQTFKDMILDKLENNFNIFIHQLTLKENNENNNGN